jgi:hypothetical protein
MLHENDHRAIRMVLSRATWGITLTKTTVLRVLTIDWAEPFVARQSSLEIWWAWFTTVGWLLRYMANLQLLPTSTGQGAIALVIPVRDFTIHLVKEVILNSEHGTIRCDVALRECFALRCVLMGGANAHITLTILWLVCQWTSKTSKAVLDIGTPSVVTQTSSGLQGNHHCRVVPNGCQRIRLEALTLLYGNCGLSRRTIPAIDIEVMSFTHKTRF